MPTPSNGPQPIPVLLQLGNGTTADSFSFGLSVLPQPNDQPLPGGEFTIGTSNVSTFFSVPLGGFFTQVTAGSNVLQGFAACPGSPFGPTVTCGPTTVKNGATNVTTTLTLNNNAISMFSITNGLLTVSGQPFPTFAETSPTGTQLFTSDPISTATGFLTIGPKGLFSLGGPLPLDLRYFFSSGVASVFPNTGLGPNWMSNFDMSLTVSGTLAIVNLEGGGNTTFQQNGTAYQLVSPPKLAYQLVKNVSGYRFLNPEYNLIYDFDTNGRLVKIEDRNGNALTVTQSAAGPTQISDGLGRTLTFTYTASGATMLLSKVTDQGGRAVSFGHDTNGNLTSVSDVNGNATGYAYLSSLVTRTSLPRGNSPAAQTFNTVGSVISQSDSEGNTTKIAYVSGGTPGKTVLTDPLGRSTTFNYADLLDISSVVDAAGNTTSVSYDSIKRPLSITDRLGNTTSMTYDPASGYIASYRDAQGNTETLTYQSQAQGDFTFYNMNKISYPDGTSESYTYDASGNLLKLTDRAGKITTSTYNSQGLALTVTNPAGGVTTNTYNADGTLASVKLPSGDVTTYTYDNFKRVATVQFADNTSVSITRDALDQILSVTNERGKTSKVAYDANNNLASLTDALNQTSKFTYDTDDLPSTASDPLGNTTKVQYDALGAATSITSAAGEKLALTYDKLERLTSLADPAGKATTYTYDAQGRVSTLTNAIGNTASVQTNKNGFPTQLTSPLKETTTIAYDSLSRVSSVTDALGRQSTIAYDSRGLPLSLNEAGGITSSFSYGDLGLLASMTDPNGGVWSVGRDNLGRAVSKTDPLGQAVSYKYDSRGRISAMTSPIDSGTVTYDAAGNLTALQFSDNTALNYTYDDDDRLTAGTGLTFGYDAASRLTSSNGLTIGRDGVGRINSITYAPGKTVTYTYDSRGLLTGVSDWTHGSVTLTLNDAHQLTAISRSNGVSTAYTYDKDGRVAGITDSGGGKTLASVAVTRDAIGRVTSSNRTLPQEASPASGTVSLNYDAADQISGATYDARGRLTADSAGATYQWNSASRLLFYSRPDGAASFTYDALGHRVSRTASGVTTNYVWNYATGLPTMTTVQSGGADVRYYVYTPGGSLLFSVDAASGAHRFYSFDETGSTTMLTGDTGAITDAYGISAYGDTVTARPGNTTDNPFTWQGQSGVMQEPGSGLFYARLRYYDSGTARFLSRDPLTAPSPRKIAPYQYAAGNPVGNGDPMGLKTTGIAAIFVEPDNIRGRALASFDAQVSPFGDSFGFYTPMFDTPANIISSGPVSPINVFPWLEKLFVGTTTGGTQNLAGTFSRSFPSLWDYRPGDDVYDTVQPYVDPFSGGAGGYISVFQPIIIPSTFPGTLFPGPTSISNPGVNINPDFSQYIQKMRELRITNGTGGASFSPNNSLTRKEIATFVVRAFFP